MMHFNKKIQKDKKTLLNHIGTILLCDLLTIVWAAKKSNKKVNFFIRKIYQWGFCHSLNKIFPSRSEKFKVTRKSENLKGPCLVNMWDDAKMPNILINVCHYFLCSKKNCDFGTQYLNDSSILLAFLRFFSLQPPFRKASFRIHCLIQ